MQELIEEEKLKKICDVIGYEKIVLVGDVLGYKEGEERNSKKPKEIIFTQKFISKYCIKRSEKLTAGKSYQMAMYEFYGILYHLDKPVDYLYTNLGLDEEKG